MLATPSLTEELQRYFCRSPRPPETELSLYARSWMYGELDYERYGGAALQGSTYEQRYAATTGLPHDAAVRLEVDTFSGWVSDMHAMPISYLVLSDVHRMCRSHNG